MDENQKIDIASQPFLKERKEHYYRFSARKNEMNSKQEVAGASACFC